MSRSLLLSALYKNIQGCQLTLDNPVVQFRHGIFSALNMFLDMMEFQIPRVIYPISFYPKRIEHIDIGLFLNIVLFTLPGRQSVLPAAQAPASGQSPSEPR